MYGIWDGTKVLAQFVAPLTVRSNRPVFMADTLSLHRHVSRRSAQRWEIETNLMPLTTTAEELFVNFVLSGHSQTMEVVMPQNIGVIRRRTSTAAITASGALGANTVGLSGANGLIPMGTFVKFANHDKVYITTSDSDTITVTAGIYPDLRVAVPAGTAMQYLDDVIMKGLYDTDTITGMVFTDGVLMDNGTVRIVERLQ
jgi:hypothetical protein